VQSAGVPGVVKRDRDGRIFIDRDPTHFRWILNYLRDGYLVTLPGTLQEKLELLQEARCFRLVGLVQTIESQASQNEPAKDLPTFFTARPSSKGLFYLQDLKWGILGFQGLKEGLDTLGVKFEEGKDEVFFYSMTLDSNTPGTLSHSEPVCQSKLVVEARAAKAVISFPDSTGQPQHVIDVLFWWEPSNTQYPQLFVRVSKGDVILVTQRGLDFVRTVAE